MRKITKYFLLTIGLLVSCVFATGCIDKSDPMYITYELAQQNGYTKSYSKWKGEYEAKTLQFRLVDSGMEFKTSETEWNFFYEPTGDSPYWYNELVDGTYDFEVNQFYSVNFDTDSTVTIDRQVVADGEKAVEPTDPTKTNYIFTDWLEDGVSYNFDTLVTSRVDLNAKWYIDGIIFNDFTYDNTNDVYNLVVSNSVDSIDLSEYLETETSYTVNGSSNTTVSLVEGFNNYTIINSEANSNGETTFNISIQRKEMYTVTYKYIFDNDFDTEQEVFVEQGDKLVAPTLDVLGYTYVDNFDYSSDITENIEIIINYTANTYTITYNVDGGNELESLSIKFNDSYSLSTPMKSRYEFLGWYNGDVLFDNEGVFNYVTNITLTAKWEQNEFYIELDANGGILPDVYPSGYDKNNSEITLPEITRVGYTFLGWYDNDDLFTSIPENSEQDFDLVAKWEANEYTITFDANEGESISDLTVVYDSNYNLPTTVRNDDLVNYVFNGWLDSNEEKFSLNGVWTIDGNITLKADWIIRDFTITYELNGGINNINNPFGFDSGELVLLDEATKEGYTFLGWYYDSSFENEFNNSTDDNITLYALFEANKYTITFDVNGGEALRNTTLEVTYDELFTLIATSKFGNAFIGWELDGVLITDGTWNIASDVTLIALYEETDFTISFELNGGYNDLTNAQGFNNGDVLSFNDALSPDGYSFTGWFYDEELTLEFDNSKYENITLYASYTPNQYTITYNVGGGEVLEDTIVTFDADYTLETPVFNGFEFVKWELDGVLFEDGNWTLLDNIEITAVWLIITYTITYDLNDGDNSDENVFEYTWEDEITLYAATRQLDTFNGWLSNGNPISTIEQGSYGNLELVASFTAAVFNITYVNDGDAVTNTSTYTFTDGEVILTRASKEEFFFSYWSIDEEGIVDATTLNQDILRLLESTDLTLYAIFTNDPVQNLVYTDVDHLGNEQSYIYYGYFPQSVVTDEELIANLSEISYYDRNELGYYEFEGNQYAQLTANLYSGDYSFNNGVEAIHNTDYFFKVESVKWNIYTSNDGTMQVMSEYILDMVNYNDDNADYSNNYELSSVREYLNDYFFNQTFDAEQQSTIISNNVVNSVASVYGNKNPDYPDSSEEEYLNKFTNDDYLSNDTNDNIFLLSSDDMLNEEYGYQDAISSVSERTATATDYAIARGLRMHTNTSTVGNYWLRTPMMTATTVLYITSSGNIGYMEVNSAQNGVRPAFNFSL